MTANAKLRRSQAERRSETRARLIDATINCLNSVGYGATSITEVAKMAGLSRAIIAYHFATKADLMVAVRNHVWQLEQARIFRSIEEIGVRATLERMPTLLFENSRQTGSHAALEITLAARGDPDLRDRLVRLQASIEEEIISFQPDLFARADMSLPDNFVTILELTHATVTGLAINAAVMGKELNPDACIDLFNRMMNKEIFSNTTPVYDRK